MMAGSFKALLVVAHLFTGAALPTALILKAGRVWEVVDLAEKILLTKGISAWLQNTWIELEQSEAQEQRTAVHMDGTPASSCLYGHPLLWRKATNILQLQTWLHTLRHAPSTYLSKPAASLLLSLTPRKSHYHPKTFVHSCFGPDGWLDHRLDQGTETKRRDQSIGGLWALAVQEKQHFRAEKEPPRLICLHFSGFVTIPEGVCWVHTLDFYWCWQRWDPLHFISEEYRVCPACCPLSTKNRDGGMGNWNWSFKSPLVNFCFTSALLALSSTWSVLLCFSFSQNYDQQYYKELIKDQLIVRQQCWHPRFPQVSYFLLTLADPPAQ